MRSRIAHAELHDIFRTLHDKSSHTILFKNLRHRHYLLALMKYVVEFVAFEYMKL
jgi:hypothetical protein